MSQLVKKSIPRVTNAQVRAEIVEALCMGPLHETADRLATVLRKYGMPEDCIAIIMTTPVCDVVAALEGKPKPQRIGDTKRERLK